MRKKLLALLLAAALALSLLAGCGGGKNQSLAQIILNLLDDQYTNVTVEIDPDLEAALRKAVNGAETEEEIRAALEEILGPGINFRLLGDGQKGDTAWNLILYPGNDPDAAGQSAFAEWNKVFAFLPKDGQYGTKIAMIETENGYAILVQATVDRAGSRDDDDDEPDEPEGPGYTKTDDNSYTITSSDGLQNLFTSEWAEASTATITLPAGNYNISSTFGSQSEPFLGTLKSAAGSRATITLQAGSNGLFGWIGDLKSNDPSSNGKVENIDFHVQGTISGTVTVTGTIPGTVTVTEIYTGAVAGINNGKITSCTVTGGTFTSTFFAGGIVGYNNGTITSCSVTGCTITSANSAGGLVGYNDGTIDGSCEVKNTSISADNYAGGLVGYNNDGTVDGTYTGSGTITAEGSYSFVCAGGLVGYNSSGSTVTGTYSGSGKITATATDTSASACAGGLVGWNNGNVTDAEGSSDAADKVSAKVGEESAELDAVDKDNGIGGSGTSPAWGTNKAYAGTRIGFQKSTSNP